MRPATAKDSLGSPSQHGDFSIVDSRVPHACARAQECRGAQRLRGSQEFGGVRRHIVDHAREHFSFACTIKYYWLRVSLGPIIARAMALGRQRVLFVHARPGKLADTIDPYLRTERALRFLLATCLLLLSSYCFLTSAT